jgi:hypothetical protein
MWRSINDGYEVSIDGLVRNKTTQRILKNIINRNGYAYCRVGGADTIPQLVHRVVAEAFLPEPTESGLEVDHIDHNRQNNHASNLRWLPRALNLLNKSLNRRPKKQNKLGETYIYYHRRLERYCVQIKRPELKVLKYFETLDDAKNYRNQMVETNHAVLHV